MIELKKRKNNNNNHNIHPLSTLIRRENYFQKHFFDVLQVAFAVLLFQSITRHWVAVYCVLYFRYEKMRTHF